MAIISHAHMEAGSPCEGLTASLLAVLLGLSKLQPDEIFSTNFLYSFQNKT